MHKTDYEHIARILGVSHASGITVAMLCGYFEQNNPRFNRQRFMDAVVKAENDSQRALRVVENS